jgi:hypothetical protein
MIYIFKTIYNHRKIFRKKNRVNKILIKKLIIYLNSQILQSKKKILKMKGKMMILIFTMILKWAQKIKVYKINNQFYSLLQIIILIKIKNLEYFKMKNKMNKIK